MYTKGVGAAGKKEGREGQGWEKRGGRERERKEEGGKKKGGGRAEKKKKIMD